MVEVRTHAPFELKPLNGNAPGVLSAVDMLPMKYWIAAGTLLGLYRDGDFIAGDTDIDVEVEGYDGVDRDILEAMDVMDMTLIRTIYHDSRPMQLAFIDQGVIFDIYILWREDDRMVNHNDIGTMTTDARFYDDLQLIKTKYGDFPAPHPVEEYLAVRYGKTWRTPSKKKGLYTGDM